jgi:hypothetical protein
MNDESNDVLTDNMFYAQYIVRRGVWVLFDCGEESATKNTMAEMRAFVHGLWRGMAIYNDVNLTCSLFDANGTLLDTLVSADVLAGK